MTDQQINYQELARYVLQSMVAPQQGQGIGNTTFKGFPSSTPTTIYGHGNGGLFSFPGQDKRVFNAMVLPASGLQARLPVYATNTQNPYYGILTGVTDETGAEPIGVCDDPPVAGLMKLCGQTRAIGRIARQSRVFELDRVGLTTNRGEYNDFQLFGAPDTNSPNRPTMPGQASAQQALNTEAAKALFELAVTWQRIMAKEIYNGNPAANTAGGGRRFVRGLNILINTGYRDAETGLACPAADPIVRSFGNANVSRTNTDIVRQVTDMYRQLRRRASRMNLMPVRWAVVMRHDLFYELTEIWPCSYATYRCATVGGLSASQPGFVDNEAMRQMRADMRGNMDTETGQYLLIDDDRVEVILDEAIDESTLPLGAYGSTIYFIPLTVLGNTPVLYWEYINYDMPNGAMDFARVMAPQDQFYTTDGGRFLWHKKPANNFCVQVLVKMEPALVLHTPHLAGRLTSVAYTPVSHEQSAFPSDPYFVNGGKTTDWALGRRCLVRTRQEANPCLTEEAPREALIHTHVYRRFLYSRNDYYLCGTFDASPNSLIRCTSRSMQTACRMARRLAQPSSINKRMSITFAQTAQLIYFLRCQSIKMIAPSFGRQTDNCAGLSISTPIHQRVQAPERITRRMMFPGCNLRRRRQRLTAT